MPDPNPAVVWPFGDMDSYNEDASPIVEDDEEDDDEDDSCLSDS